MRRMVLVVCLIALLAGCSALPSDSPPPSDDRAVAAIEEANSTVADVEAYRFDTRMYVSASDGDQTRTARITGSGKVNVSSKRMQATTQTQDQTRDSYVSGYRAFQECPSPWPGYGVENISRSDRWATVTPLHRQLMLFERSNVYWGGNRTGDSNQTVLIVAYPTAETIQSLMDRRQSDSVELDRGSLENATARLWIDPETNQPVKSKLRLKISRGGATATAILTLRYTDYGEPVEISIPSEVYEDPYEHGCPGT